MPTLRLTLALVVAAAPTFRQPALAQRPPASSDVVAERRSAFCLHPRPLARCGTFLISEFGIARSLEDFMNADSARGVWELGLMRNRSPTTALGAGIMLTVGADLGHVALNIRYRRWLAPGIPLDVVPGVIVLGSEDDFRLARMLGFTAHVGVSLSDIVGAFGQLEIIDHPERGVAPRLYLGGRLGSIPGAVAGLAAAGLLALASAYGG